MSVTRFDRDGLVSTAWKNGGGSTREIVRMPVDSSMDTFDWRVSIADITEDGPFSRFVGVDRVLVLLSGDGAHLKSSDGSTEHRLDEPLIPFAFAGETPIDASLIGGASSDFNVMVRRATTKADLRVVRARETLPRCSAGVLFSARGEWKVQPDGRESDSISLDANAGLWWDRESLGWQLTPRTEGAALIAVRIL